MKPIRWQLRKAGVLIGTICLVGVWIGTQSYCQQQRFDELTAPLPTRSASSRFPSDEEAAPFIAERNRFISVLALPDRTPTQQRARRDKMVPFLLSFHWHNAIEAAQWLGQSEDETYLPALRQALKNSSATRQTASAPQDIAKPPTKPSFESLSTAQEMWQPPDEDERRGKFQTEVQMAIARIETRDLKGEARLKSVAGKVGITFDQLRKLFAVFNVWPNVAFLSRSKGRVVVDRSLDVLADMGLKGEDIKPFLTWTLMPQHKVRLEAATMPRDKGIEHILNFLCIAGGLDDDTKRLAENHLHQFGPSVNDRLMARINDIASQPKRYTSVRKRESAFICLFAAAGTSRDPRLKPLLHKFAAKQVLGVESKWVAIHAADAIARINTLYPKIIG